VHFIYFLVSAADQQLDFTGLKGSRLKRESLPCEVGNVALQRLVHFTIPPSPQANVAIETVDL